MVRAKRAKNSFTDDIKHYVKSKKFFLALCMLLFFIVALPFIVAVLAVAFFVYVPFAVCCYVAVAKGYGISGYSLSSHEALTIQNIGKCNQSITDFLNCPDKNEQSFEQLIKDVEALVFGAFIESLESNNKQRSVYLNFAQDTALFVGFLQYLVKKGNFDRAEEVLKKFRTTTGLAPYENYDESATSNRNKALPFWNMYLKKTESLCKEIKDRFESYNDHNSFSYHNILSYVKAKELATDLQELFQATSSALQQCLFTRVYFLKKNEGCDFSVRHFFDMDAVEEFDKPLHKKIAELEQVMANVINVPKVKGVIIKDDVEFVAQLVRAADGFMAVLHIIDELIAKDRNWPNRLCEYPSILKLENIAKKINPTSKTISSLPEKEKLSIETSLRHSDEVEKSAAELALAKIEQRFHEETVAMNKFKDALKKSEEQERKSIQARDEFLEQDLRGIRRANDEAIDSVIKAKYYVANDYDKDFSVSKKSEAKEIDLANDDAQLSMTTKLAVSNAQAIRPSVLVPMAVCA